MLTSILHSHPSCPFLSISVLPEGHIAINSVPFPHFMKFHKNNFHLWLFGMDLNFLGGSSCSQTPCVCKVHAFALLIVILPHPDCSIFSSSVFQISITSWQILHQTLDINKRCYASYFWYVNNFSQRSHLVQQMQMSPQ